MRTDEYSDVIFLLFNLGIFHNQRERENSIILKPVILTSFYFVEDEKVQRMD